MRGRPELSSFSQEYTEYAGGGVSGRHTLYKNDAITYGGIKNQHFQSTLLGVTKKKSTLCTLLIMLTILDDPLHWYSLSV